MNTGFSAFVCFHLWGDNAIRPSAPRPTHLAALLLLAGSSPLRRHALPDTPLFLAENGCVLLPVEATYMEAYHAMGFPFQDILDPRP